MVATDACSRATWASSAIVTLSRKRRCTRTLTVRSNHVAVAEIPSASAAMRTILPSCPSTPLPSSASHQAINASGNAASNTRTNAASMRPGSWRYPSLHSRHMDGSAGGKPSPCATAPWRELSGEDVIDGSLLVLRREALGLEIEHRPVAAAERHQLLMGAELDHPAVLQHTDAVGMAHRREAVRDEDGRAVPGGGEDAFEDLGLAAHVELRGGLVEQHDPGAQPHRAQRAGESDALPLSARQVGASFVAAGQHGVEARELRGTGFRERGEDG